MEERSDLAGFVRIVAPLLDDDSVEIDEASVRRALTSRLRWIIDNQFARLAQLLYRFDVDERRVERTFATTPAASVHEALADLVLERAWEKLRSRTQRRFDEP